MSLDGHEFSAGTGDGLAGYLAAAISVSDDAEPNPIVCTEKHAAGNSGKTPNARGHLAEECTSGTHWFSQLGSR